MKTKLFLAAMAVTFSFAMISCSGNKTANTASGADSVMVDTVAAATCAQADSCCQAKGSCCKDSCAATCDKANGEKSCCEKKANGAEKKSCCEKK